MTAKQDWMLFQIERKYADVAVNNSRQLKDITKKQRNKNKID